MSVALEKSVFTASRMRPLLTFIVAIIGANSCNAPSSVATVSNMPSLSSCISLL
ncbi:hypothetical protein D3C76_1812530 [compost metagenome]